MAKEVTKRNGLMEPFDADKMIRLGKWATKGLGNLVSWSKLVVSATAELPDECTTDDILETLIRKALEGETWSNYLVAGRLYAASIRKILYGSATAPTIKSVQDKLVAVGLMRQLPYSADDYAAIEKFVDHNRDFAVPHFSLHHIRKKYALMNRVEAKEYESQQFTYMRLAMTVFEHEKGPKRLEHIRNFYNYLSLKKLSAPSPNFSNLGTPLESYASCCLYSSNDNIQSLAIGDHIAYIMTAASAGIGSNTMSRSLHDPVRGGIIAHRGKLPYKRAKGKAIAANLQNGRGGAGTDFTPVFDPEIMTIIGLRNVRNTEDKKIRDLHYAVLTNPWFAKKVANNEKIFLFNPFTAPDLDALFYSADLKGFIELYEKYEADDSFKKQYLPARDVLVHAYAEGYETGTLYFANIHEINRHTPFKDTIYSSNLCLEIAEPTIPYENMMDLYSSEDHGRGEIATCNLAAVIKENIESDEEYAEVVYYALRMIDYCILRSKYPFPHLALTAKARMNAGVGVMGYAVHMAKNGLKYSSLEGKAESHRSAETHAYHLIRASLRISKERGLAPWIHKTKWPEGWLPIDTYCRGVDEIGNFPLERDWETLRSEIIENGGIGHSVLNALMPGEASSKAAGTSNSIYPIRELAVVKTDNFITTRWAAPFGDNPNYVYESAWDIEESDLMDHYALWQKFTDQTISADVYKRIPAGTRIQPKEIRQSFLYMTKRGVKTRYYLNTQTAAGISLDDSGSVYTQNIPSDTNSSDCCSI